MSFKAEIDGKPIALKSFSGGQPVASRASSGSAGQTSHSTATPYSVSDLTLVVYLQSNQNVIAKLAYTVATLGKDQRVKIKITQFAKDMRVVKTYLYEGCLLTRLDYPTLNATSSGYLCETATFKPAQVSVS